jgi:hypothetical protein
MTKAIAPVPKMDEVVCAHKKILGEVDEADFASNCTIQKLKTEFSFSCLVIEANCPPGISVALSHPPHLNAKYFVSASPPWDIM